MSTRNWSKGPMIDAFDPKCECGSPLVMASDGNGMLWEQCQNGCFKRPVQTRRPSCPECGQGPWGEKTGCEACGFGVREIKRPVSTSIWDKPKSTEETATKASA